MKPKNWRQTEQNGVNVWPNAPIWARDELRSKGLISISKIHNSTQYSILLLSSLNRSPTVKTCSFRFHSGPSKRRRYLFGRNRNDSDNNNRTFYTEPGWQKTPKNDRCRMSACQLADCGVKVMTGNCRVSPNSHSSCRREDVLFNGEHC